MTAALIALVVAALGASATAVTLALQSRDDRVAAAKLAARAEALTKDNGDVVRQLGAEAAGRIDDQHRYEAVIAGLKAEVTRLQGELDADLEPTAVRDRLAGSGVLSGTTVDGTVAAPRVVAAASLPGLPTPGVVPAGRPAGGG